MGFLASCQLCRQNTRTAPSKGYCVAGQLCRFFCEVTLVIHGAALFCIPILPNRCFQTVNERWKVKRFVTAAASNSYLSKLSLLSMVVPWKSLHQDFSSASVFRGFWKVSVSLVFINHFNLGNRVCVLGVYLALLFRISATCSWLSSPLWRESSIRLDIWNSDINECFCLLVMKEVWGLNLGLFMLVDAYKLSSTVD